MPEQYLLMGIMPDYPCWMLIFASAILFHKIPMIFKVIYTQGDEIQFLPHVYNFIFVI